MNGNDRRKLGKIQWANLQDLCRFFLCRTDRSLTRNQRLCLALADDVPTCSFWLKLSQRWEDIHGVHIRLVWSGPMRTGCGTNRRRESVIEKTCQHLLHLNWYAHRQGKEEGTRAKSRTF